MYSEIRHFLSQEPNTVAFRSIIKFLKGLNSDDLGMVVSYLEDHLDDWPDHYRSVLISEDLLLGEGLVWERLVRHLDFSNISTDLNFFRLLSQTTLCDYISHLDLDLSFIPERGTLSETLFETGKFQHLKVLNFQKLETLNAEGRPFRFDFPQLENLLGLSCFKTGEAFLSFLETQPSYLPNLKELSLTACGSYEFLTVYNNLENLQGIKLNNMENSKGLSFFSRFENLKHLHLKESISAIGPYIPCFPELRSLKLETCSKDWSDLNYLSRRSFPKLKSLSLKGFGPLTKKSIQIIKNLDLLKDLEELELSDNPMSDSVLREFSTLDLGNLKRLILHNINFSSSGTKFEWSPLLENGWCEKLDLLDLRYNFLMYPEVKESFRKLYDSRLLLSSIFHMPNTEEI